LVPVVPVGGELMITKLQGAPVRSRRWVLPLTYAPKIPGVIGGTLRQTIRPGGKYRVGDWVAFHGWEGLPYRSRWSFRTGYFLLYEVKDIIISRKGIRHVRDGRPGPLRSWHGYDELAARDGIQPPTGEALRDVLLAMHKIPEGGLPTQVIRW
jgi:hypothetical protein